MSDYIKRDDAKKVFCDFLALANIFKSRKAIADDLFGRIPAADVRPHIVGHWNGNVCSNCGARVSQSEKYFCCNCGAEMRERDRRNERNH